MRTAMDTIFAARSLGHGTTAISFNRLQRAAGTPIRALRDVVRANEIGRERTILQKQSTITE